MRIILVFVILIFCGNCNFVSSSGKELLEIDKFDSAIKEFSSAIEKGRTADVKKQFLDIIKLKPNKEIIKRIAELTGLTDLYPITSSKYYEWYPIFSPDGSKIVFQGWQKGISKINSAIYIMDIDGRNIKQIVGDEYNSFNPQFSPDNGFVMFQSVRSDTNRDGVINSKDNSGIYIVDVITKMESIIVSDRYLNYNPQFSYDSRQVVLQSIRNDTNGDGLVNSRDNSGIYVIDVKNKKESMFVSDKYLNYNPQFSPDSRLVAFKSIRSDTNKDGNIDSKDNTGIYVVNIISGKEINIARDDYLNKEFIFSNDSKIVLFSSIRRDTNRDKRIDSLDKRGIYLIGVDDRNEMRLVGDEYDNEPLGFSPDGKSVMYASYRTDSNKDGKSDSSDNRGLHLASIGDALGDIQVVDDNYDNKFISFYPDGKRIIFESWRKDTNNDGDINILDNSNLYLINVMSMPTMKIDTVLNSDGTITRTIEVTTDPMFRKISKYIENALSQNKDDKKLNTEFIKEGEHHFKLIEKYNDKNEFLKSNYSISFLKHNKVFFTSYEYRETFKSDELSLPISDNPIINLAKEMGSVITRPMTIQFSLTIPGKKIQTNAMEIKHSNLIWIFSISDLIKSKRDCEIFVIYRTINSGIIVLLFIIVFSAVGTTTYKVLKARYKKKLKMLELVDSSAEAYNYLGTSYKNKLMYDDAIANYKKAIELSKKAIFYYNISCCYALKNDVSNAIINLKEAIAIDRSMEDKIKSSLELKEIYKNV